MSRSPLTNVLDEVLALPMRSAIKLCRPVSFSLIHSAAELALQIFENLPHLFLRIVGNEALAGV